MKKVKWLWLVPFCASIASGTIFVDGISQSANTTFNLTATSIAISGGMTNNSFSFEGIPVGNGSNVVTLANQTASTLAIINGTSTVNAISCLLIPGNGTNVVLLPGTWSANDQIVFGVAISNFGYGIGYTNSLSLPTNFWSEGTATNIICTNTANIYWLIGGRGAQQAVFEVRQ